jgi:para-aminobenzoate synthetase component I
LKSYAKTAFNEKLNSRVKIPVVREIDISADRLVSSLLDISKRETVCILDSCGVSYLGSHLLIAGINPAEILEIYDETAEKTLKILDEKLAQNFASIFTISYDFGLKLENIKPRTKEFSTFCEPDVFLALFECLIIHDYTANKTFLVGNVNKFDRIEKTLLNSTDFVAPANLENSFITSNFTRSEYLETIEKIKEFILRGDTYQTNLTQQFRAKLPANLASQDIFLKLRKKHPAPFAAFLKRRNDSVVSASPERFFMVQREKKLYSPLSTFHSPLISTSPIKGTRPRGKTPEEDLKLKNDLLDSEKERAENTMIVDLLRNDLGRICKFGSVRIDKLCDLEEHPTFFHLVSTVKGELRDDTVFSEILKALFPCGSITGAPKIRTMQTIDELETINRGLSMGAIGYSMHNSKFKIQNIIELSVAIRTLVIKDREAIFNVGGGIVIDSVPELEYEETLIKAKALFEAINGKIIS